MTILSKVTVPYNFRSLVPRRFYPYLPTTVYAVRAGGHAHVFLKRHGMLVGNRVKDMAHFYLVGIGFIPLFLITCYYDIKYGPCELSDYPTEGPPPRFWQFERTVLRQLAMKYITTSDIEGFERNLAYVEKQCMLDRFRREEIRAQHLMHERWDYKGYYYQPVSSAWIDRNNLYAHRVKDANEEHSQCFAK